jgi:hypothetical protein
MKSIAPAQEQLQGRSIKNFEPANQFFTILIDVLNQNQTIMEQAPSQELFSLHIDPVTKSHLWETARWGKFLSVVGFVLCGLLLIGGLFFSTFLSTMAGRNQTYEGTGMSATGFGAAMAFFYIIFAVIYFFLCLFLYRFASKMKTALHGNSQEQLNLSFQNLKSLFKYVGVITIIILALYALMLVLGILGLAAGG